MVQADAAGGQYHSTLQAMGELYRANGIAGFYKGGFARTVHCRRFLAAFLPPTHCVILTCRLGATTSLRHASRALRSHCARPRRTSTHVCTAPQRPRTVTLRHAGQVRTCGAFFIVSTIREKCIQYKASLPPSHEAERSKRLAMLPTDSRLPGGERWPPRP